MTTSIQASVGAGGTNEAGDVQVVQDLLNRAAGAGLEVDGSCGDHTRAAIVDFQKGFLRNPDGRVDPDGVTLRRLSSGAEDKPRSRPPAEGAPSAAGGGPSTGTRLQPLGSGGGWYSYSKPERQFGGESLLAVLRSAGAALAKAGLEYGIGDLSFEQGGKINPHKTHTSGRHADLRPLREDGAHSPTSIGDPKYSRENTRALVKALRAQGAVTQVLFNDSEIEGVHHFAGHDNHLHIQVR